MIGPRLSQLTGLPISAPMAGRVSAQLAEPRPMLLRMEEGATPKAISLSEDRASPSPDHPHLRFAARPPRPAQGERVEARVEHPDGRQAEGRMPIAPHPRDAPPSLLDLGPHPAVGAVALPQTLRPAPEQRAARSPDQPLDPEPQLRAASAPDLPEPPSPPATEAGAAGVLRERAPALRTIDQEGQVRVAARAAEGALDPATQTRSHPPNPLVVVTPLPNPATGRAAERSGAGLQGANRVMEQPPASLHRSADGDGKTNPTGEVLTIRTGAAPKPSPAALMVPAAAGMHAVVAPHRSAAGDSDTSPNGEVKTVRTGAAPRSPPAAPIAPAAAGLRAVVAPSRPLTAPTAAALRPPVPSVLSQAPDPAPAIRIEIGRVTLAPPAPAKPMLAASKPGRRAARAHSIPLDRQG